jgi:HEAT repeat protein
LESERDVRATVEVSVVGWHAIADFREVADPGILVLLDGKPVGILRDPQPRSFPVAAGVHRVAATSGSLRSRTLVLSLAAGELAALECGLQTGRHLFWAMLVVVAVGLSSLANNRFGVRVPLYALGPPIFIILMGIVIDLLQSTITRGARLYVRPRKVVGAAGKTRAPLHAPDYLLGYEPGRFQIDLRRLLIIIACCAPIFWVGRELWDRRPENAPARAIRMLRSADARERQSGASDLRILLIMNSLAPKQIDAAIPFLLIALRDQEPSVREAAAGSLLHITSEGMRRSGAVPRAQSVAVVLAEAVHDTDADVRHHSALALAMLYFTYSSSGAPAPPLPEALDRFLDLLSGAVHDPNADVQSWTFQVLKSIAPHVMRPAPSRLVEALRSQDAVTRREAAYALAHFPVGIDTLLPKLFEYLAQEKDPKARRYCSGALTTVRPSRAAIPALVRALRSPEEMVRFRAAELLSRIGPKAIERGFPRPEK